MIKEVKEAVRVVFQHKPYLYWFVILALLFLSLFLYIPIWAVPANSLSFQLAVYTLKDYVLLSILALLTALVLVFNIFAFRRSRLTLGHTAVGGASGAMAALFGTATCASCLATLFGFLSLGTVFALLTYRYAIVGILGILMLGSLFLISKKITRRCNCP